MFFTDADRRVYLESLKIYCGQARVRVLTYCLMTNHIHLVAVPEEEQSLAIAMRRTNGRYALYLNARRRRVGHLWQSRFYSCAMDEPHLLAALRYVEHNPVRAKLVQRPEDYPWSSAAAHLVGTRGRPLDSVLDWEFHAEIGGSERWVALLAEPEELTVIRRLQRSTFTGRPLGSPQFVAELEQRLGRTLAPHQGRRLASKARAASE